MDAHIWPIIKGINNLFFKSVLGLSETWIMPDSFFGVFFYVSKKVSIYFSFLGECCEVVLLWDIRSGGGSGVAVGKQEKMMREHSVQTAPAAFWKAAVAASIP